MSYHKILDTYLNTENGELEFRSKITKEIMINILSLDIGDICTIEQSINFISSYSTAQQCGA